MAKQNGKPPITKTEFRAIMAKIEGADDALKAAKRQVSDAVAELHAKMGTAVFRTKDGLFQAVKREDKETGDDGESRVVSTKYFLRQYNEPDALDLT